MRLHFSLDKQPFCGQNTGHSPEFCSYWTHPSCQRSSPLEDVEHRQQGECPVGILGQAAIAHLGKAPETLEDQEGVFNLSTHTGLAPICGLIGIAQRTIPVSAPVGKVLGLRRQFLKPFPLLLAAIRAVAVEAVSYT